MEGELSPWHFHLHIYSINLRKAQNQKVVISFWELYLITYLYIVHEEIGIERQCWGSSYNWRCWVCLPARPVSRAFQRQKLSRHTDTHRRRMSTRVRWTLMRTLQPQSYARLLLSCRKALIKTLALRQINLHITCIVSVKVLVLGHHPLQEFLVGGH